MGKMSEKAALITGATGFLGRQVVQAFGRQGWTAKGIGFSRADGSKILKVDLGNTNDIETVLDDTK